MKQHKRDIVCLLVGTLFAACSDAQLDNLPSEELVQLNLLPPTIKATPLTRTMPIDGTTFPWEGRNHSTAVIGNNKYSLYNVSLSIYNHGTNNPHMNGYGNKKVILLSNYNTQTQSKSQRWTTNGSDTFVSAARLNANVDIYAYYPHVEGVFPIEEVPFTTDEQHDWMWATPVNLDQVSESNRTVKLTFQHAMTCIEVRLCTKYYSTINLYSITLSDKTETLTAGGTMNIKTGELNYEKNKKSITIGSNNSTDLLPIHNEANTAYLSYCFLMPEKEYSAGDLELSFKFDRSSESPYPTTPGRSSFKIPSYFQNQEGTGVAVSKLERGKKYVINLMVDNTMLISPLSFTVEPSWNNTNVDVIL